MTTVVRAVYLGQALRLDTPLPISEGATIQVTVNLPEGRPVVRKRFTWENGPILPGDCTNLWTDELRRQRDAE